METDDSVWRIIRALHRAATLQQRAAATAELGYAALGVLNAAAVAPGTPSALSRELGLPPQTVSRAVAELEAATLIERHGDPHDGRSYTVQPTTSGRSTIDAFRRDLSERFVAHLTDWTAGDVSAFAAQLEALVGALEGGTPAPRPRERRARSWRR
ncbi:MarR family winged helix-turn-helix transcriptional regulator [Curtobacterium pusillum]|uniref:DNA-binding MarR family transcriptional regulator n=1 Tax=Curtobacterium pusillum TaxID=69373 RepID=A0AAW3T400_9MICO|nr:MarR family winged helix-turn-helix transcriptional regulator [Curtobacterium pusillum]MBA8989340.1 DNA-binding MarR family transcriptional regulator [Curtobacterium pusillum]NUU15564.1 winged helix-turn-helix transcriptional regulator [Curtobacterium pusillum]